MPPVKLLIIDDEEDYASALAERLGLRGFEARAVYDARNAQTAIETVCPDVILLDLFMPGMEAKDMIDRIKDVCPEAGIIIVSGHRLSEGKLAEMNKTALVKPVDIKELVVKINEAVLRG